MGSGEWRTTCCRRRWLVKPNKRSRLVLGIENSADFVRRRGLDLSVIGLGKLGSPMVACFAAKGHRVIGVDVNERFVRLINEGKPPVSEPGLEDLLKQANGRLSATTDIAKAVAQTDVTFLIVPTPSESDGA